MDSRHFGLIALACAALCASVVDAQVRHIASVPQPARQAAPPGVATFGLPNPAGLGSAFPAGLPSSEPAGLAPLDVPNLSSPGTAPGSPAIDAGIAKPLSPGGGGGVIVLQPVLVNGANVMGAPAAPHGPYSALDIARAFLEADVNHDGQLSRAEAQRLSIPLLASFDDLDRDHDGFLSRFEYEDAFR